MSSHYDNYDYPQYWESRQYEHESEILAIKHFLFKIPKIKTALEIGAGYGRLVPSYIYRASKIVITDPSATLLKIARNNLAQKKVNFIQSNIENFKGKIRSRSCDLVVMVRVLHHVQKLDTAFSEIQRITKKDGYLILEFANKRHLKAIVSEFFKGNITFFSDIFPKDVRSKINIRRKTIPFINYHPDVIYEKLKAFGFEILEVLSVSNIRNPGLKKLLPLDMLLFLEKNLQKPLSAINFGPSVFVLARKKM